MLKKITATGVVVAGITGAMLLASPANAAQPGTEQAHPIVACYSVSPYVAHPAYCTLPGYRHHHGWGRWHHHHGWYGWRHHRFYR